MIELVCATVARMFRGADALAAVLDDVVVGASAEGIAAAHRLHDVLGALIAEAESEYAKARTFEADGYGTMAAFERHGCQQALPESRRTERRAARMAAWPEVLEAWKAGRLTGTQVDLMASKVPDRHVQRFAVDALEVARILSPLSAHQTGLALTDWVGRADAEAESEAAETGDEQVPDVRERELFASRSIDDALFLKGTLDPDSAAVLEKALTAATRPDADGERRSAKARRADALVEVCRSYLASLENPDANRNTERLTVVVDITTLYGAALRGAGVVTASQLDRFLAERPALGPVEVGLFLEAFDGHGDVARTLDGSPVSEAFLSMVSSGGTLERLLTAEGRVLDQGRSIRNFTAAQRRAILARDGGCRTPGCDAGPERCDVHHVDPWEEGGRTDIANGVAKCRRCHLEHHRRRWRDRLDPDGTYRVTTTDGVDLVSHPPGWITDPALPVATTAESAREVAFVHERHRPRCDCPCPEHRSAEEEAEFQESRRLTLARFDTAA